MMALFSVLLLVVSIQVTICKPYDLAVTDVGSNSAIIHWKTTELSTTIENFRILCNGTRHYVSMDGEHVLDTDNKLQYAPSGTKNARVGALKENFSYSCTVQEGISSQVPVLYGEFSDSCNFSTDYGDPEQPKTPEVQISRRRRSVRIKLFPTSTRFGPISGYQVQFHLVESKTLDGLALIDDDAYDPRLPSSPLVSKNEAQLSTEAKSFWLDFENGTLPVNIVIGQKLLQGALKDDVEYTVATMPYTVYMKENESVLLFTPSNLSAIFKTWNASLTPALLDTKDPAELALVVALGVGLPLLLLGYLACFAVALYCFLRRRKKKRMRKEYSRRDVIQALALRRAQQMGIELPWYNHRTTDENQGDLPWLDPFSPANAQSRIVSSSSSQVDLHQLEADYSPRAQPPDPVMPNDVALTDTPPVYSTGTDLSGRQGDINSTAAAQKFDAVQLVAAVLTRAVLVVSRLTAAELAGQGISGTAATQPYDHDDSFATSDDAELAESDAREDCEKPIPHRFVEKAAEKTIKGDDHDLAVHATLAAGGSHISVCSSASSSSGSDCHFSCSQDSTHSLIGSEHLSLHQVQLTEQYVHNSSSKCNDRDFGDSESLSGKVCIEMEESFYSSKSSNIEEQSASETHGDGTIQSVGCEQLKMDTLKASQIDDQSSSDVFNPRSLRFIASEHLSLHQIASTAQCVLTAVLISSNCGDHDLSENKSLSKQASLEVEESFHSFKSEEEGSSDIIHQRKEVNAVQSANYEQLNAQLVASADQCTKSNGCDDQSSDELEAEAENQKPGDTVLEEYPSASVDINIRSNTDHDLVELALPLKEASPEVNSLRMGRIDSETSSDFSQDSTLPLISGEHQSLHQVESTEQCVFASSKGDGGDLGEEGVSLEVESFYSSKSSNSEEASSSDILQLEDNAVQSAADRDSHSIIDLGAENDCNLGESKPPPEEGSLEVEKSFYSSKSRDVEERSASVIRVDITAQPTDFEQLSAALVSTNPCNKSSHCDGHSTDDSGREKQLPGGAVLELQCSISVDNDDRNNDSELVGCAPPLELNDCDTTLALEVNSSRTSKIIDDDSSSDYFQGSIQSMDEHFSLHQVASSAECIHTVSLSSNYRDLSNKSQTEDVSSDEDKSYCSSKQTSEEKSSQSTRHENLSPQPEASAALLDESGRLDGCTRTACDVEEIIAASLQFKQMVYDSRSSTCRLRHIYTEYNLAEHKPLLEECSLEVNVSSLSSKASKSDSSSLPKFCDSTPSISSEPSMNGTTVNHTCSSSDFCLYIAQSSACERLSLRQGELTAQSVHNSSRSSSHDDCGVSSTCEEIQRSAAALELTMKQSWESDTDDYTNYNRDVIDKPLPITTSQASSHSTKVSLGDGGTSYSLLHQDGLQTAGVDQHQSPHQLASADQSIESSSQLIAGSGHDGHITNAIHVGTEEPLAGDARTELNSLDFHPDIVNFQSPHQLASAADQFMQSNSLKSFKLINSAGCSSKHVSIDMEDTDYFTASSSQCSSEPAAGSEDGHTTPNHPMMSPNQHGYYMASSDPYSFNIGDARISASYSSSDCSYPLEPDDEYPSLQQVEATVQRLPRFGNHQLSPVGSVVSAENETHIFMELDEVELPYSRHGDQELPAIGAMSYNTVVADPSTDYYSTMNSHHNSGHWLSPELPHSRYGHGDQELPDASIDATSHHTVVPDPSTDYYSAVSETSSHNSGNHLSPVGSVLSSEDDVRIIMESPSDNNSMLKMSSSTSLFIPRGLSNGPLNSSSSLNSCQRNDSTTTFHSILLVQLSGSSDSEEDKHQRSNDPQLPPPIYEPY